MRSNYIWKYAKQNNNDSKFSNNNIGLRSIYFGYKTINIIIIEFENACLEGA